MRIKLSHSSIYLEKLAIAVLLVTALTGLLTSCNDSNKTTTKGLKIGSLAVAV
jgi:hypothetical protein